MPKLRFLAILVGVAFLSVAALRKEHKVVTIEHLGESASVKTASNRSANDAHGMHLQSSLSQMDVASDNISIDVHTYSDLSDIDSDDADIDFVTSSVSDIDSEDAHMDMDMEALEVESANDHGMFTNVKDVGSRQGRFEIVVKTLTGESFKFADLEETTTVADLKALIGRQQKIPPARQRLIFKGKEMAVEGDTLAKYNIQSGSIVHMFPRVDFFSVKVKFINSAQPIEITHLTSDRPLCSLQKSIQEIDGVPPENQQLIVSGEPLGTGHCSQITLGELGIRSGSLIGVVYRYPRKRRRPRL